MLSVEEVVKVTEQLFQLPYCICFLICCFAMVDSCRACGIIRTNEKDERLANILRADKGFRSFIFERALDAIMTELCTIGGLCFLMQSSEKTELIVVVLFPSLLFVRVMVSLHSRISHVLKIGDDSGEE